ncbi:hypothetical protein N2152v2_006879 [Parachlorella kessleri]
MVCSTAFLTILTLGALSSGVSARRLTQTRSVEMQIATDNRTSLLYTGATMVHGDLSIHPLALIPEGKTAVARADSDGMLTGMPGCASCVQGTLNFAIPNVGLSTPCNMIIQFDDPFFGSNGYICALSADAGPNCGNRVFCNISGGDGDQATLSVSVGRM